MRHDASGTWRPGTSRTAWILLAVMTTFSHGKPVAAQAPQAVATPNKTAAEPRVLERANIGGSQIEILELEFGQALRITDAHGTRTQNEMTSVVVPPCDSLGGEDIDDRLKDWLGPPDNLRPAPILSRCFKIGPGGQPFLAVQLVYHAAVCTSNRLMIMPIRDGSPSVAEAEEIWDADAVDAGDELRIWCADFRESGLVVPGHGSLAQSCLQWNGRKWVIDLESMREPPLALEAIDALVRELRASWTHCHDDACSGGYGELASALGSLIFSGNARQAEEVQRRVLEDEPAKRAAFVPLFRSELAEGCSHLDAIRELNGGSLGAFEEAKPKAEPERETRSVRENSP